MRVFVTGANGYVGSAIVEELAGAGHEVLGLVRSAEKGRVVERAGARPMLGDATEPVRWIGEAERCDALMHCIEPATSGDAPRTDMAALEALLAAARAGNTRVLLYTSGCWSLGATGDVPAGEDASTEGAPVVSAWRVPHERLVLEAATPELATAVIRPGIVWGGASGLFSAFFRSAVDTGAAELVGDGGNRWSCVHRRDVARLYRLVAERAGRGIFHGVDGAAIPVRHLAQAASDAAGRGGAVRAIPLAQARAAMGPLADALALDQVLIAPRSVQLGWAPAFEPFTERAAEAFEEWRRGA